MQIKALGHVVIKVSNLERSEAFYRDVLGANIWFDRPFTLDGGGLPIGKKGDRLRLVIVKFEHDQIGMMGLMEFLDPVMPAPEISYDMGYGKPVFVVVAEDGLYCLFLFNLLLLILFQPFLSSKIAWFPLGLIYRLQPSFPVRYGCKHFEK